MLHLDTRQTTLPHIQAPHGLDLDAAYQTVSQTMARHLEDLHQAQGIYQGWSGWLRLGDTATCKPITTIAHQNRGRFDDLVILGIGGSSLGAQALLSALCHPQWNQMDKVRNGAPRYHFVDNMDADLLWGLLDCLDLHRTLVVVISKSGTTLEPLAALMVFLAHLEKTVGTDNVSQHVMVITDPEEGPLFAFAQENQCTTFEIPADVGGRFSVFSAVGLLPAALCGISLDPIQQGIQDMATRLSNPDIHHNPAAQLALIQYSHYQNGKPISVFMPYASALQKLSQWVVQLWGESLGKRKNLTGQDVFIGPTPLGAIGSTDQHSLLQLFQEGPHDKWFTFVHIEEPQHAVTIPPGPEPFQSLTYLTGKTVHQVLTAQFEGTRDSLAKSQRPSVTISLPQLDAYHLSQLMFLLQVQTALAGPLFGINPFDQPGVEQGKQLTKALLQ